MCISRIYVNWDGTYGSLQRWANLFINKLVDQSCRQNRPRFIILVNGIDCLTKSKNCLEQLILINLLIFYLLKTQSK